MEFDIIRPPDEASVTLAVRALFESSKPDGAVMVLLADHVKFLKNDNRVLSRTEYAGILMIPLVTMYWELTSLT